MRPVFQNQYGVLGRRTPTHLYLLPHPDLRPFVAHYTLCLASQAPPAGGETLSLIPDASGCLVFTPEAGGDLRLYGPTTRVVTVTNDLGRCPTRFFVEFRPGGLRAFSPLPQWELADRVLPLAEAEPRLHALLERCWTDSPNLDEFVAAVDRGLRALLRDPAPFHRLLDRLGAANAPAPLLEAWTGYSPRHLARLFREETGLSAKRFSRVVRVNRAVRAIQAGECSLTALAQELGYFDQAHFIHAFRAVCGVSPSAYRAGLSDFYNEPLKF